MIMCKIGAYLNILVLGLFAASQFRFNQPMEISLWGIVLLITILLIAIINTKEENKPKKNTFWQICSYSTFFVLGLYCASEFRFKNPVELYKWFITGFFTAFFLYQANVSKK